MSIQIDEDGTIYIYCGDSGEIVINGLYVPEYATKQITTGEQETGEVDSDRMPITQPINETVIDYDNIINQKNFTVFFEIQDSKRSAILTIKKVNNGQPFVTFNLTPEQTDKLTVPINKPFEKYYYGVKACELGKNTEDTLFVSGKTYGELNTMIVYPKQAEGD